MNPTQPRVHGILIRPGSLIWSDANVLGVKSGYCPSRDGIPYGKPLFKLSYNSDDGYVLTSPYKETRETHLTEFDANLSAHRLVEKWSQEIKENQERREKLANHYQRAEAVHVASIIVSFIAGIGFTVLLALLF